MLVGLSFFELCELAAKRVETSALGRLMSVGQEQALVDDALLNYIFVNTLKGWTSAELKREINVPEPMFVDALIRLEKLGLIGLLPGNEIRLRTSRDIQWRKNGPYSRFVNMLLGWSLNRPDVADPKSLWALDVLKLSSGSLAQLQRKFDALLAEAVLLSEQDRRSNDPSRDWHALVLTARHIAFTPLSEWPTQYKAAGGRAFPRAVIETELAEAAFPSLSEMKFLPDRSPLLSVPRPSSRKNERPLHKTT